MLKLLLIALGGAFGAMARYATGLMASNLLPAGFPYATLIVNVTGSFIIGCAFPLIMGVGQPKTLYHGVVMVGFLGAFTTFSTFSLDTIQLLENGQLVRAGINVFSNLILCLGACWLGLTFVRGQIGV